MRGFDSKSLRLRIKKTCKFSQLCRFLVWHSACTLDTGNQCSGIMDQTVVMNREVSHQSTTKKSHRGTTLGTGLVLVLLVSNLAIFSLVWACFPTSHRGISQFKTASAFNSLMPLWGNADFSTSPGASANGPVYPYSVIPGGVSTAKNLQLALGHDPVAAAHYSGFATHSAHVIRLAKDRQVYVSYRMANRIYWTRKKVTLHAGEALLTDGAHFARTRCGNRISELPAEPTAPSEPAGEVLDKPVVPHLPEDTADSLPPAPIWAEPPPPVIVALGNIPQPYGPGGNGPYQPPYPVPICCATPPGSPSSPIPPPNPLPQPIPEPPGPPVSTPEPQSLVLLVAGLAGFALLWKLRRV